MTVDEARTILARPVFGNPEHIKAVRFLEQVEEAERLRVVLRGKETDCWCCNGSGYIDCHAGCLHDCPTCDGADTLLLTTDILADLTYHQLLDIFKTLEKDAA